MVVEAGKRVKRGTAGFLRLSAVCEAAAGGIILLTSAIWWAWWGCWVCLCGSDGLNGCRSWATRLGEKEALNGVLNEVLNGGWWRQKKGCPKVPISLLFGVAKNGQKWGWTDSWVDNWVDNLNKQRPL